MKLLGVQGSRYALCNHIQMIAYQASGLFRTIPAPLNAISTTTYSVESSSDGTPRGSVVVDPQHAMDFFGFETQQLGSDDTRQRDRVVEFVHYALDAYPVLGCAGVHVDDL